MGKVLEEREDSQVFDTIRKQATDGSEILAVDAMQPEVDATREYWVPALAAIEDAGARAAMETTMFVAWRRAMLDENARGERHRTRSPRLRRIDLEVKDLKERSDTISKITGEVLEDMT